MTGLRSLLRRLWSRLSRALGSVGRRVFLFLRHGVERVSDRWDEDGGFRRTLSAAITAITATAIPHPAVSAALGALLADRPRRPTSFDRFDDEDDDYPRSGWPSSPRRLWDTLA